MLYTSQSGSEPAWTFERHKNFLCLAGTEPRTLGCPACVSVSTPNELDVFLIEHHELTIYQLPTWYTDYYLFIKYYFPLHVSSLKCSSSGGYSLSTCSIWYCHSVNRWVVKYYKNMICLLLQSKNSYLILQSKILSLCVCRKFRQGVFVYTLNSY